MGQARHAEERHFYILSAIKAQWSSRELERQIRTGAALRGDRRAKNVSPALALAHPTAIQELYARLAPTKRRIT